ncbi:MAG: glutaredoxin family protein [Gammaproteobacteria bacterium]|nr:glutaredoxin family protein [Gammaproteobacteria bacterium]
MSQLTLYTRQGCPLCVEMQQAAEAMLQGTGRELQAVDIDADTALKERYDWRVPVLAVVDAAGADIVCEGHFDPDALRDLLED